MQPLDRAALDRREGLTNQAAPGAEPVAFADDRLTIFHLHQKTSLSTGSVQQMIQAAEGFRNRGHRVLVVTRPSCDLQSLLEGRDVATRQLPFRHLLDVRTILGLRRLIAELEPDLIHVHKGLPHWLALVALSGNRSCGLVANRGVSFPLTPLNRAKYRSTRTDRVVAVCESIRETLIRSGRIAEHKIEVVYAGTDMTRFDSARVDPKRFRTEMELPADAFVILQTGTRDWKGWRDVVDAFAELRSTVPHARLVIAGHDSDERERRVREYLALRELTEVTRVVGYRSDMEQVIAAADVLVDASWAGTGITGTVREAMALGTAVVATDCGGNREIVSGPDMGWLVAPRNHTALLGALRECASDPRRRASIGRAAAAQVRSRFSIERRLDRLESIYNDVVASRKLGTTRTRRLAAGVTLPR